ncbi:MAG TPA: hypothetical protein VGE22_16395, partial [Solimonas sp.]
MSSRVSAVFGLMALALSATPALADSPVNDRLDAKGERIEERLDRRGDRINDRLDAKGERIEDRMDRQADRAAAHGNDARAEHLE